MSSNTVAVAMSGGVDSSVTAALLKNQGYQVIGVTMQLAPTGDGEEDTRQGATLVAVEDARRVAALLDIPHHVLDLHEQFECDVVDYFLHEYGRGRTPNPCVACNRFIKFDALLNGALALDARYLATGHYARVSWDDKRGRFLLRTPRDVQKDQTYALYTLTQEQLSHVLFPLGELTKDRIRQLAEKLGLPVADKPESQDICFIPDGEYGAFLERRIPTRFSPGPIVDTEGNVLGQHTGLPNYTYGQRKGLGITAPERLYVVDIQHENNTLVVGTADQTLSWGLIATDLNLISLERLPGRTRVHAKIRYNSPGQPAVVEPLPGGQARVRFDTPDRAVTPGQSVVFYQGDEVLGGGIIERPLN